MDVVIRDPTRSPGVIELPAVVFPVELEAPRDFDPERPGTWPAVDGRLEYVEGRLLYMPPTGGHQAETVADVVMALADWARAHPELSLRSNEAGMKLGDEVRAADVAVFRVEDLPDDPEALPRKPPVLAVEVAGRDDGEQALASKARWYLERGVSVVWALVPRTREVIVLGAREPSRHRPGERLPEHPELPGLAPLVDDLFRQVLRRGREPRG